MRQIMSFLFFCLISPPLAAVYMAVVVIREVVLWHRRRDRYRYSTPAQRKRFAEQHSERLHRIDTMGQPV